MVKIRLLTSPEEECFQLSKNKIFHLPKNTN